MAAQHVVRECEAQLAMRLEVDERWSELPRLVERVRRVKGVADVHVNGRPQLTSRVPAVAMPA